MINSFHSDSNNQLQSKLIDSVQYDLYKAFQKASEAGKRDSLQSLIVFANRLNSQAISNRAPEVQQQLYFLPSFFFKIVEKNAEFRNLIIGYQSTSYKSAYIKLKYHFERFNQVSWITVTEKFYLGVISFYHLITESLPAEELRQAYNEYNQMSGFSSSLNFKHRTDFILKHREEIISADILHKYKTEIESQALLSNIHRRASLSLRAWFVYMFSMNKISLEKLNYIEQRVELKYSFFEDLMDDVNYILDHEEQGFLGIKDWDFTVRDSGKTYSPPSVSEWILQGMVTLLLRTNGIPRFDLKMVSDRQDILHLFETVNRLISQYRENIEHWKDYFGIYVSQDTDVLTSSASIQLKILELFDLRSRLVLNIFERLKIMHDQQADKIIKSQVLSKSLVDEFKISLTNAWKEQCTVFRLFDSFDCVNSLNSNSGLTYFGQKTFMERAKMMFVEETYQPIFGSSDIGAHIGRMTDSSFLNIILQSKDNLQHFDSEVNAIEYNLNTLITKGYHPDLIIIPPELSYKGDLANDNNYIPQWEISNEPGDFYQMGSYRGIPVISFYAPNLKNQIICCEFKKAFSLDLFESPLLYESRLHIDIRELTIEEIESKFTEAPEHWKTDDRGLKITEEQARTRIATGVILEMWSQGKFTVLDQNAYVVSTIENLEIS